MSTPGDPSGKIVDLASLLRRRDAARAAGRRVVHCHGCFDIVHPGHIRHLRQARSLGDVLLVSITGDGEMVKGVGRPLIPEELRAENLAALDCVDWVYIEPRATAVELLGELKPDVYVKGREYEFNNDPRFQAERRAVESGGGRVVFSSGDVVFSSTALIAALERTADPFQQRLAQLHERPELQGPALFSRISGFRGRRVLVVGETINDTYVFCDRPDVAGESPILSLRPIDARRYDGGAAVIARHAAAMGAKPVLVTALPDSGPGREEAEQIRRRLASDGVEVLSIGAGERVPEKQRLLVGQQKMVKLDLFTPYMLDATTQDRLASLALESAAGGCDAAVLADFGMGLFTPALLERLCRGLRPLAGVMAGDVSGRRSSLLAMRGVDLLCPSESELRDATRSFSESLPAAAWSLLSQTSAGRAIVTMGADGLIAFDRAPDAQSPAGPNAPRLSGEHVPALSAAAVDPLGCGDALLTAATLALASGSGLTQAAYLGAAAASVQVQRLGNGVISAADLRGAIARVQSSRLAYTGERTSPSTRAAG